MSFLDGALAKRRGQKPDALAEIDSLVDWAPFERLLGDIHNAAKGEAAYPPLLMFKVVLLQRWHNLTDPAMELALYDRISFLRFAGLSAEDETPDHATIWRFRQKLAEVGLMDRLFEELRRQLESRGMTIKQGTLIDASLVSSAARRPRMEEGKTSPTNPDARFGANNERGRFQFGYKMHVAVDQKTSLVRDWRLTSANVQEVVIAPEFLATAASTVYADRGYDTWAFREALRQAGLGDGVMRRARSHRPLSSEQIAHNHALSLARRTVEAVFGTLKRC
jgi:IS5 family transposase